MSMLKQLALVAFICALALPALAASDDDDLAPLTPIKKAPPKKAPPPPVVKPPPQVVKKAPPKGRPAPSGDDDLAPLRPVASKGEINVRVSTVQGAMLSIDGKELGTLPLGPQTLPSGEHLISVKRAGYAAFVKKVLIANGKSVDLEAKLAPVAAVISVTSDVSNAQVFINGRLIGTAPITDYEVPPGAVELSVLKEGFREDKQKLTLVAGKDYPVSVKFAPPPPPLVSDRPVGTNLLPSTEPSATAGLTQTVGPPIYQRWYFWAGVVVVVAAAAAVGTAVAVNAAQPPGHYSDKQLCPDLPSGCTSSIR